MKTELTKEEKEATYKLNRSQLRKASHIKMSSRLVFNDIRVIKIHGDLNRKKARKYKTAIGMRLSEKRKQEVKK